MALDSKADPRQIVQAVFCTETQSIKACLTGAAEIAISAASGDSIYVIPMRVASKATVASATPSGAIVLSPFDSAQLTSFQLFTNTTSALSGQQISVTLEISPSDSDNVWLPTDLSVSPTSSLGATSGTAITNQFARRVRLKLSHTSYTAGSFDVYLVARSI